MPPTQSLCRGVWRMRLPMHLVHQRRDGCVSAHAYAVCVCACCQLCVQVRARPCVHRCLLTWHVAELGTVLKSPVTTTGMELWQAVSSRLSSVVVGSAVDCAPTPGRSPASREWPLWPLLLLLLLPPGPAVPCGCRCASRCAKAADMQRSS